MGVLHNECDGMEFIEHYFFFSNGLILMLRTYDQEGDNDILVDVDATTVSTPLAVGIPVAESLPVIERWARHNVPYREMCNLDTEARRICEAF